MFCILIPVFVYVNFFLFLYIIIAPGGGGPVCERALTGGEFIREPERGLCLYMWISNSLISIFYYYFVLPAPGGGGPVCDRGLALTGGEFIREPECACAPPPMYSCRVESLRQRRIIEEADRRKNKILMTRLTGVTSRWHTRTITGAQTNGFNSYGNMIIINTYMRTKICTQNQYH